MKRVKRPRKEPKPSKQYESSKREPQQDTSQAPEESKPDPWMDLPDIDMDLSDIDMGLSDIDMGLSDIDMDLSDFDLEPSESELAFFSDENLKELLKGADEFWKSLLEQENAREKGRKK